MSSAQHDVERASGVVLCPSKSRPLKLLLVCAVFIVIGVWLATEEGWIGYLCIAFFGMGIPLAVIQLMPGSTYLHISADELRVVNLFRTQRIPWDVVDQFFVVTLKQTQVAVHKLVAFNYVPSYDRSRLGRRLNSIAANCEGALPNTYGKTAEELSELLNVCLEKFAPHRDRNASRTGLET